LVWGGGGSSQTEYIGWSSPLNNFTAANWKESFQPSWEGNRRSDNCGDGSGNSVGEFQPAGGAEGFGTEGKGRKVYRAKQGLRQVGKLSTLKEGKRAKTSSH